MTRKKGPARRLGCSLFLLVALAVLSYAGWARLQLGRTLAAKGDGKRETRYGLVSPSGSPVKTSWPFVVRAAAKRLDVQNWLPDGDRGLVEGTFYWSPGEWKWIESDPAPLDAGVLIELKALSVSLPPKWIEALADRDARRREVAFQALRIETGQDLGYRPDLPPERQEGAIAAWKRWWDANKLEYGREKLEKVFGK
jgi:hypothetical protein